jgi:tetratricopeptide (TPR) repeat protein
MNEKVPERVPGEGGVEEYIHKAYELLKKGDAASALGLLKWALEADYEHQEVLYALKCLNWWLEKIKRLDDIGDSYERGEFILSQWKSYYVFLERIGEAYDLCQYALKRFVFSKVQGYFLELLGDGVNQQDPALLLQIGRCCKGAGDWEEALKYLEQASRYKREDSSILLELADVNALLGDDRKAKVLFREAFFLDPQTIDLGGLESEIILRLRDKVKGMGYSGPELAEWIPVWGCIWGIFSIKRELKPVELGRLKQSILSLENEYRSQSSGQKSSGQLPDRVQLIRPRLLNRYFWLIDHCEHNRDTSGLIDETMLKIKFIDPVVYEHYKT